MIRFIRLGTDKVLFEFKIESGDVIPEQGDYVSFDILPAAKVIYREFSYQREDDYYRGVVKIFLDG